MTSNTSSIYIRHPRMGLMWLQRWRVAVVSEGWWAEATEREGMPAHFLTDFHHNELDGPASIGGGWRRQCSTAGVWLFICVLGKHDKQTCQKCNIKFKIFSSSLVQWSRFIILHFKKYTYTYVTDISTINSKSKGAGHGWHCSREGMSNFMNL